MNKKMKNNLRKRIKGAKGKILIELLIQIKVYSNEFLRS